MRLSEALGGIDLRRSEACELLSLTEDEFAEAARRVSGGGVSSLAALVKRERTGRSGAIARETAEVLLVLSAQRGWKNGIVERVLLLGNLTSDQLVSLLLDGADCDLVVAASVYNRAELLTAASRAGYAAVVGATGSSQHELLSIVAVGDEPDLLSGAWAKCYVASFERVVGTTIDPDKYSALVHPVLANGGLDTLYAFAGWVVATGHMDQFRSDLSLRQLTSFLDLSRCGVCPGSSVDLVDDPCGITNVWSLLVLDDVSAGYLASNEQCAALYCALSSALTPPSRREKQRVLLVVREMCERGNGEVGLSVADGWNGSLSEFCDVVALLSNSYA